MFSLTLPMTPPVKATTPTMKTPILPTNVPSRNPSTIGWMMFTVAQIPIVVGRLHLDAARDATPNT